MGVLNKGRNERIVGVIPEDYTEEYEGRKACDVRFRDSRPEPCGCKFRENVHVASLFIFKNLITTVPR